MPTWDEAAAEIDAGHSNIRLARRRWFPWISRTPIAITGPSGSGKTELWRQLTGRPAKDKLSDKADEGYAFLRRRKSLALETIPGQASPERDDLFDRLFGPGKRLKGIIFVASYGFSYVWPELANQVAAELGNPANLTAALRERNFGREYDSYKETCDRIRRKFARPGEARLRPDWLLVIVNKADLYWPNISDAKDYYTFGCNSQFDEETQRLFRDLGGLAGFTYKTIPAAMRPVGYNFLSDRWSFNTDSALSAEQRDASLYSIVKTLEELCGL